MLIDNYKLDMLLAQRCMNRQVLRATISAQTLARIRHGSDVKPRTVGRIARCLGVSVEEIVAEEVPR